MARVIRPATIEAIRAAIDLPAFFREVEPGIGVHRSGRDYRSGCPFEDDHGGSKFSIRDDRFKCYNCGQHGDVFNYFEKRHGMSFEQAVEAAARHANVTVEYEALTAEAQARQAVEIEARGVLEALVQLAQQTAAATPAADQAALGFALGPLIKTGEIGRMPDADTLRRWAVSAGVTPAQLDALGLTNQASVLAGRWMLWARDQRGVAAGRPLDERGPVIGIKGARSVGWVQPPPVKGLEPKRLAVAMDDTLYVALRSGGFGTIARPLTPGTVKSKPHHLLKSSTVPPMCLVRPVRAARASALADLVHLLPVNPRARVLEIDLAPLAAGARDQFQARFQRALPEAGVALDWAIERLVGSSVLDTVEGREYAAAALARLVDAVDRPLERALYAEEVFGVTGLTFEAGLALAKAHDAKAQEAEAQDATPAAAAAGSRTTARVSAPAPGAGIVTPKATADRSRSSRGPAGAAH